jgi:hypothetical protein
MPQYTCTKDVRETAVGGTDKIKGYNLFKMPMIPSPTASAIAVRWIKASNQLDKVYV